MAPLRVNVNVMKDDLDIAISNQDFQKAMVLKEQIKEAERKMESILAEYEVYENVREAKNDVETILKCLDILIAFMQSPKINNLSGALRTILDSLVKPVVLLMDPITGHKALKCFALMCYKDRNEALDAVQVFCAQVNIHIITIVFS